MIHGDPTHAVNAKNTINTATARPSWRIGRNRLRTWSDQMPAPTRPAAPASWKQKIIRPAVLGSHPRWPTRYTSVNAEIVNCGVTSNALAAWMRHSVEARYGEDV